MKSTEVSIFPDLILLGEDHGGLHVQPGHGVRPVLCQHHWLAWEYWSDTKCIAMITTLHCYPWLVSSLRDRCKASP